MNTTDFTCWECRGLGELSHSRGNQGFICEPCKGSGHRLCDLCMQAPAVAVIEGDNRVCERCLSDVGHDTAPPPSAPITERCLELPANDVGACEVVDPEGELLLAGLMLSAVLVESAREAGVPLHEAARMIRKAGGR